MPLSTRSFASPFLVAMLRCRRALFVNLLWTTLFVGCAADESVGPQDLTPVVFAYCPSGVPLWAAFRNEGAAWQRLEFDASGRTEFAATPRFGMAFVTSDQLSIASRVR